MRYTTAVRIGCLSEQICAESGVGRDVTQCSWGKQAVQATDADRALIWRRALQQKEVHKAMIEILGPLETGVMCMVWEDRGSVVARRRTRRRRRQPAQGNPARSGAAVLPLARISPAASPKPLSLTPPRPVPGDLQPRAPAAPKSLPPQARCAGSCVPQPRHRANPTGPAALPHLGRRRKAMQSFLPLLSLTARQLTSRGLQRSYKPWQVVHRKNRYNAISNARRSFQGSHSA